MHPKQNCNACNDKSIYFSLSMRFSFGKILSAKIQDNPIKSISIILNIWHQWFSLIFHALNYIVILINERSMCNFDPMKYAQQSAKTYSYYVVIDFYSLWQTNGLWYAWMVPRDLSAHWELPFCLQDNLMLQLLAFIATYPRVLPERFPIPR